MQHVDYLEHDAALFGAIKRAAKGVAKGVGGAAKGVAKGVGGAAKGVAKVASTVARPVGELSKSPLWNIAQTGVSFIPGVGQGVSAGMAAAAALGRGQSVRDIALQAARGAIPGGPVAQAAFDVAVGAVRGQRIDRAALGAVREQLPGGEAARAAFDAGVALAEGKRLDSTAAAAMRNELGRSGRDVFDRAVRAANVRRGFPSRDQIVFPGLGRAESSVARALATQPGFRGLRLNQIASRMSLPTQAARKGAAAWLQRFGQRPVSVRDVGDFDSLEGAAERLGVELPDDLDELEAPAPYPNIVPLPPVAVSRALLLRLAQDGPPDVRRAIQAHGLLAMLAQNVGELDGTGGWVIRSGDLPFNVAQKVTGDGNRWKEIPLANPDMKVVHKKDSAGKVIWSGIEPWTAGKRFNLPPGWIVGAMPEITVPTATSSVPGVAVSPSVAGGPPFPPPSVYPAGYPSAYYIVQAGDTGTAIAKRITGDGNRWKELRDMNPGTADPQIGMRANVGQKLHLPPTWVKPQPILMPLPLPVPSPGEWIETPDYWVSTSPGQPTGSPSSSIPTATFPTVSEDAPPLATLPPLASVPLPALPVSLPSAPAPVQAPAPAAAPPAVTGTTQQVASVQVQLGYFFKAHSDATWSIPDAPFGTLPSDYDGVWDQRSFQAMGAFQKWWNARNKPPSLRTDGMPDAQSIAALRAQIDEDLGMGKAGGVVAGSQAAPKAGGGDAAPLLLAAGLGYVFLK